MTEQWKLDALERLRILRELAWGDRPRKPDKEISAKEHIDLLFAEMTILGRLGDPESQFRKDYEAFVASTGKPCPLLENVKRGDAWRAERRKRSCGTIADEPDFEKDSE